MTMLIPSKSVFGLRESLPLEGFPEGRIKVKLRHDCFAVAYVKTKDSIRAFAIKEDDGKWKPLGELQANHRVTT